MDRLHRENERRSLMEVLERIDALEPVPERADLLLSLLANALPIISVCAAHRLANAAERQADALETIAKAMVGQWGEG